MRLYLTGGTGFVGSNIIKVATERYGARVFTTVHSWQPERPLNFEYGRVDIRNRAQVLDSVRAFKPDAIIHAAILNDFMRMYRDRKLAWQAYVDSTRYLTQAANLTGAKMIFVNDRQGIFHCCGGQSVGRMELALAAARVFGLDAGLLQYGPPDWSGMVGVPVPEDTSLSARYTAEQLDYPLPDIEQILQTYRWERETGSLM